MWSADDCNNRDDLPASVQSSGADLMEDVAARDIGFVGRDGEKTTVFVNAANSPPVRRPQGGEKVPFAGPGFQPVIVDLQD